MGVLAVARPSGHGVIFVVMVSNLKFPVYFAKQMCEDGIVEFDIDVVFTPPPGAFPMK